MKTRETEEFIQEHSVLFQPLSCCTLYFHVFQTTDTESGLQNKAFQNKGVQTSC